MKRKLYSLCFIFAFTFGWNSVVQAAADPQKNQIPMELQNKVLTTIQDKCLLCHSPSPANSKYGSNPEIKFLVESRFKRAAGFNLEENFVKPLKSGQKAVALSVLVSVNDRVARNSMPPKVVTATYPELALTEQEKSDVLEWITMYKAINYGSGS